MKKMAEPERNDDHRPNGMLNNGWKGKGRIISAMIYTGEVEIIERSDSEREPRQNEELPMKLLLDNGSKENPQELVEPGPWQPQTETIRRQGLRGLKRDNNRIKLRHQQFYGKLKGCEKAVLNSTECRERKGLNQEEEQRKGERRSDIRRNRTAEEPFA
ncbi:hypothetical protein K438DRAFT_1785771 [Mycena galopus ATCC 62051]|nr:hypothetical protein K438DRAFT_1785771 [Mycena galopus ATCC 62051]